MSAKVQNPQLRQDFKAIPKQEFKQEILDTLLFTFNSPINGFSPKLSIVGQSTLTEFIINNGWNWTLDQLNAEADTHRTIEWNTFEKVERDGFPALQQGVYYGQMLDGLRNGLGIAYCTTHESSFWLFECEWKRGLPVHNGRYIKIQDAKWFLFQGTMDNSFHITGSGCMLNQEGHSYKGNFKNGLTHGKGEYKWPKGVSYKGEFANDKKHGKGKMTFKDGSRQRGVWDRDVQIEAGEVEVRRGKVVARKKMIGHF
ncbi:hypothetical protein FGO68_gene14652 [Halteria grandinella]|uniref:MORN repeat protein n=1 Tax=Halteria grandinella TaxID=5974 RepID=A0A8J8NDP7_HALGN|nr:hypothetical protein FGO68_gene14652 [Halteria grandinella]